MQQLPPRMQDKLYHDMILPEETLQVRKMAREFAMRELAPIAYEIAHREENKASFPFGIYRKLSAEGLLRVPFSKDVGGFGLRYPAYAPAVVVGELAYMSNSIASVCGACAILAGNTLSHGSNLVKKKYLMPMIAADKIVAFATSEPTCSTDLSVRNLKTTAERRGTDTL